MRVFGGRFIHFMGGYKRHTDIVQKVTSLGPYSCGLSEINFADLHIKVLRSFDPYSVKGEPGIYADIIKVLASGFNHQFACLIFDSEKTEDGSHSSLW